MSGVTYCPFWGTKPGECRWSYDSTGQSAKRYLETHLRVNHKGQTVPAPEPTPPPARPARPADRDAREVAAIDSAGAEKQSRPRGGRGVTVSREECIAALRAAAEELGHSPSSKWWHQERRSPSHATVYKRLGGTWAAVLEAAGLAPVQPPTVSARESEPSPVPVEPPPSAAIARQGVRTSDLISFILQRSSLTEIREMRNDAVDRVAQHKLIAEQAQAEADLLDLALERLAA